MRLVAERLQGLLAVLLLQVEQLQVMLEFIVPFPTIPLQVAILSEYQFLVDEAGRVQRGREFGELATQFAVAQEFLRAFFQWDSLQIVLSRVGLEFGAVGQQAQGGALVDFQFRAPENFVLGVLDSFGDGFFFLEEISVHG